MHTHRLENFMAFFRCL